MAVIGIYDLAALRRAVARKANEKGVSVHWLKGQINVSLQAIEDRWEAAATKTLISGDIESAAPGVFSNAEKKFLTRYWLEDKARREEVGL